MHDWQTVHQASRVPRGTRITRGSRARGVALQLTEVQAASDISSSARDIGSSKVTSRKEAHGLTIPLRANVERGLRRRNCSQLKRDACARS